MQLTSDARDQWGAAIAERSRRRRRRAAVRAGAIALGTLLIIAGLAGGALYFGTRTDRDDMIPRRILSRPAPAARPGEVAAIIAETSVDRNALRNLTPEEAELANSRIPVVARVGPAARPLVIPMRDGLNYMRALDCLTTAIYYESANEPTEGQRAVAQVILNRVRHAIYPHTVCGVVFQGSERSTGCQFSFTCDGAMGRTPVPALWSRARSVAGAALAGYVYAPVGLATHYHADYVLPKWAPTLLKQAVIGRHIFYRWPSYWGTPPSFTARYGGNEQDVWAKMIAAEPTPMPEDGGTTDGNSSFADRTERPVIVPGSGSVIPASAGSPQASPGTSPAPAPTPAERTAERTGAAASGNPPPAQRGVATGGVIMSGSRLPPPAPSPTADR